MKKFSFKGIIGVLGGLVLALAFAAQTYAVTPSLSLVNNGYGMLQATVYGDANATIVLDYYSGGQLLGAGVLGYTTYNGTFTAQLNPNNYPLIPNGAQVVIMVNGQQSAPVTWTSTYTGGTTFPTNQIVTLSQNTANLTVGQTQSIIITSAYAYSGTVAQYYINNQSGGFVSASVAGNTVTLYGQSNGSGNVSVCTNNTNVYYNNTNNNCATIYVSVTGSNYYNNPVYYPPTNYYTPISASNTNLQLTTGSTGSVQLYGGTNDYYNQNNFYVSNNNSSIATATVSGNLLTVYGNMAGNTTVTVCQNGGNQCVTIYVTVTGSYNNYPYNNYPYNNGSNGYGAYYPGSYEQPLNNSGYYYQNGQQHYR